MRNVRGVTGGAVAGLATFETPGGRPLRDSSRLSRAADFRSARGIRLRRCRHRSRRGDRSGSGCFMLHEAGATRNPPARRAPRRSARRKRFGTADAGALRDHRDLLRDSHHVGLGMLNVADEARSDFLGVETQKSCVAAKKRHQVEPIRKSVVAVGLDHFDVMRRQMSLGGDLLASQAFALAGFGNQVAERRFRRARRPRRASAA